MNYDEETLDFVRHGLSCYDCGLLADTEAEHYTRLFNFLGLDTWLMDKVVVDVGCGVGALLEALKRRFPASQGFGLTNCAVQLHLAWDKGVSAYHADMDHLDYLPADLFIFAQSIGHAKSMPAVVAECAAKLKSGGRLFIKDFDCVEVSARNAWNYRMEPAANFVQAATQAGLRLLKQEIPEVSYERYMRYWRESTYMTRRYGPAPEYMIAKSVMLLFEKP